MINKYCKISLPFIFLALYLSIFTFLFHDTTYNNNDGWYYRNTGLTYKHTFLFNPGYPHDNSPLDYKNRLFLPNTIFVQIEGPFVPLAAWLNTAIVGDLLPLTPAVCATPNIIFAIIGIIFAYKLGKILIGTGAAGYIAAFSLATFPWVSYAVRCPWYYHMASPAFGFMVWYYLVRFLREAKSRYSGLLLGVSLILYIGFSPDFPLFIAMAFVYALYMGKSRQFLLNRWNALPVTFLLVLAIYFATGYLHKKDYYLTILASFFEKFERMETTYPNASAAAIQIMNFFYNAWGIGALLAMAGMYLVFTKKIELWKKKIFHIMMVWLIIGAFIFIKGPRNHNVAYAYVLGVPLCLLSALTLYYSGLFARIILSLAMVIVQLLFFVKAGPTFGPGIGVHFEPADNRMLAVADYLLENRNDIKQKVRNIEKQKHYLLSKDKDTANTVYVFSRHSNYEILGDLIRLPVEKLNTIDSCNEVCYVFFKEDEIAGSGELAACWNHPKVLQKLQFRDKYNRRIFLGIIGEPGSSGKEVTLVDAEPLAERYYKKYYRKSYMQNHMVRRSFY